jgi:hypothetical protein
MGGNNDQSSFHVPMVPDKPVDPAPAPIDTSAADAAAAAQRRIKGQAATTLNRNVGLAGMLQSGAANTARLLLGS